MNRILDDKENWSWMANGDPTKPDSTSEHHKKRKRIYRRCANPPYSYLAMIALAILNTPERKLKLSQIFYEISTLFPFFKGDHWAWKDTIRHNLSCNDCFRKVLKDPLKPKAKGNYWTVDVSRIPEEALKLKNTTIARQDAYPEDLTPYILHGKPYSPLDFHHPSHSTENILHVQPCSPFDFHHPKSTENTEFTAQAEDLSLVPSQPPCIDPAASFPMILWNLPTSYSKCVAPNVVAPPSIHPLLLYSNFPSISLYNCMPSPSSSSTYAEQRDFYSTSLTPQMPPLPRPSEARYSSSDFPPNNMTFDIPIYPPHGGYMPPQNVYGQNLSQGEVYSGPNGY